VTIDSTAASHAAEVAAGTRFEFGKNWSNFLSILDDERIAEAEKSLQGMLRVTRLDGMRFLDIGSGSGLFSLAARRLGATVHSFDFDTQSVACTTELRRRYFPNDSNWKVEQGSVLDEAYVRSLGQFDIVYSWGVLHHTGQMWKALEYAAIPVRPGGRLFIAIYNHQVYLTSFYSALKRSYVKSPGPGKAIIGGGFVAVQAVKGLLKDLVLLRNPATRYRVKKTSRGMSMWYDWIDWVGGYPFEVAKPDEIFDFFQARGFDLDRLVTCGSGHGCNEFVLRRRAG
jgi:2-polyprenyl-3-methyl-5-hydroxy-6-metoxy-1,4-benzoquinol methylase